MEKTSRSKESSDLFRKIYALPLSTYDRKKAIGALDAADRVATLVATGLNWLRISRRESTAPKLKRQLKHQ